MRIFSGLYKGRLLHTPAGIKTRPTAGRLREALFNICQAHLEGIHFLDLFAGSGAMGFEALSRGAHRVTFIDLSKESIRCIKENISSLGIDKNQVEVLHGDVFEILKKLAKQNRTYDIIYADPPYETSSQEGFFSQQVIELIDELLSQNSPLLTSEGFLFVEDASKTMRADLQLKCLSLKSSRQMGRSMLKQFEMR